MNLPLREENHVKAVLGCLQQVLLVKLVVDVVHALANKRSAVSGLYGTADGAINPELDRQEITATYEVSPILVLLLGREPVFLLRIKVSQQHVELVVEPLLDQVDLVVVAADVLAELLHLGVREEVKDHVEAWP